MYTSGTTDNPKGIIFNQTNIITKRFARALALPDIGPDDNFLCYLPLFHTFGRWFEMMGAIFWGATYTFTESTSFKSLLKDFKIAILHSIKIAKSKNVVLFSPGFKSFDQFKNFEVRGEKFKKLIRFNKTWKN